MRILLLLLPLASYAGSISDDLHDWMFAGTEPHIVSGIRADGESGKYIRVPMGTTYFGYEVFEEGEGTVEMWIKDNTACIADSNPGYPVYGPIWGFQTRNYSGIMIGMIRSVTQGGCSGYSVWSTLTPYDAVWFKDGVRGANGSAFTAGWYRWSITGRWDDIVFTLHDVTYQTDNGPPYDDSVFGDCSQRYDAASNEGNWESVFGDGFNGVIFKGDASDGCETIDVYIIGGSGVFSEVSDTPLPVSSGYINAGWSEIKGLFR